MRPSSPLPGLRAVRRVNVRKGKDSRGAKIVRLARNVLVAVRRRAVSGVRAVVIVPVVIGARAVTVPVAAVHSRWHRKSSWKN